MDLRDTFGEMVEERVRKDVCGTIRKRVREKEERQRRRIYKG